MNLSHDRMAKSAGAHDQHGNKALATVWNERIAQNGRSRGRDLYAYSGVNALFIVLASSEKRTRFNINALTVT